MLTRHLPPRTFSKEERERILGYVLQLRKDQIQTFLREHGVPTSGTKEDLRERLVEWLDKELVSYIDLVNLVDSIEPWGKQHVYLFAGSERLLEQWRSRDFVERRLKDGRVYKYLNKKLPLILPPRLALSSIEYSADVLRVTAIERRDAWERDETFDSDSVTDNGERVELRAFVHIVSRGIMAFEWNLSTNSAMLQISQLPAGFTYEEARVRFAALMDSWLSISSFSPLDLGRGVNRLHIESKDHPDRIRSHGIGYVSLGGRRLLGRSASADESLLGETVIDSALEGMSRHGTGFEGNFFFLSDGAASNPIAADDATHVLMMATKGRVNFTTSNDEDVVRYVLARIRNACR